MALGLLLGLLIAVVTFMVACYMLCRTVDSPAGTAPLVPYFVPWVGHMFKFLPRFIPGFKKANGPVYRLHVFGTHVTFSHLPEDSNAIFSSKDLSLTQAYGIFLQFTTPTGFNFVETDEDGQQQIRYFHALFNAQVVKQAVQDTRQFAIEEFEKWNNEGEVELFSISRKIVMKAICRMLFGTAAENDPTVSARFFTAFSMLDPERALTNPMSIFAPRQKEKAFKMVVDVVKQALAEIPAQGDSDSGIGMLTKLMEEDGMLVEPEYLAQIFIVFSLGAFTNLYAAVGWSLYHVIKNKEWSAKIREERSLLNAFTADELLRCRFTRSLTMEVTRFYARGMFLRYVTEPKGFQLPSGFTVPQGELCGIYIPDLSFEPTKWEEPYVVKADRFIDADEVRDKGVFWTGFGRGKHPCLGMDFSLAQSVLLIQLLLERFDFESTVDDVPMNVDQLGTIFKPVGSVVAHYRRRN